MWVTNDCAGRNCHSNMIVGLVRSAARDNPALDYVLFDIENSRDLEPVVISKTLLRHKLLGYWRQRDKEITIPLENELLLNKEGKLTIPRLIANAELNNRYNSNYRQLYTTQSSDTTNDFSLVPSSSSWDVVSETSQGSRQRRDFDLIQLRANYSILSALRVSEYGLMFLMLGENTTSKDLMVYLSPSSSLWYWCYLSPRTLFLVVK